MTDKTKDSREVPVDGALVRKYANKIQDEVFGEDISGLAIILGDMLREAAPVQSGDSAELVSSIIRDVAELPDRNSPEDWPEAMLVTSYELRVILDRHLESLSSQLAELDKLASAISRDCNNTALERNEALAELAAEKALREGAEFALKAIKGMVCGERNPNWSDNWRTTGSRGRIADIVDIALGQNIPRPAEPSAKDAQATAEARDEK